MHDLFWDPDSDNWSLIAEGLPAELTIDGTRGVITGRVSDDADVDVHSITLVATDDRGGKTEISFKLTIRAKASDPSSCPSHETPTTGAAEDARDGGLIGSPDADLLEETPDTTDNRVEVFYGGAGDDTFL